MHSGVAKVLISQPLTSNDQPTIRLPKNDWRFQDVEPSIFMTEHTVSVDHRYSLTGELSTDPITEHPGHHISRLLPAFACLGLDKKGNDKLQYSTVCEKFYCITHFFH